MVRLISVIALLVWTALMALAAWLLGVGADLAGYFVEPATDLAKQAATQAQNATGVTVLNPEQINNGQAAANVVNQGLGLLETVGIVLLGIVWFIGTLVLLALIFFAARIGPLVSKLTARFTGRHSHISLSKRSDTWYR
jgi:hypothetical protein